MKALVKYGRGKGMMEIRDVPVPSPGLGEVLIKVKSVGVCGTDLKIYDDTFYSDVPVIVGHEFSGVIKRLGEGAEDYRVGDRVVAEQHVKACGVCGYCLSGQRHLCPKKRSPGYLENGAYAEYIAIHKSLLHRIPDDVSFDTACLIEPMAIAAHALFEKALIEPEDTAVILGCGPIALMTLQILKAEGASAVFMTGLNEDEPRRFALALECGADLTINVQKEDPVKILYGMTDGRGVDLAVDLSGAAPAILQGLGALKKNGRFCAIGLPHGAVCLPWSELVLKAASIYFSFSSGYRTWERCLSLLKRGKVDLEPFIHDVYELNDWETAFNDARSAKALKAIIRV
jgi:threonine dehydrogenase-like Zn-dependent dehydrogenase